MRIARHVAFLFALAAAPVVATHQTPVHDGLLPPAVGTGVISGTLRVDDAAGAPIRRAQVHLSTADAIAPRVAITDDAGAFAFTGLPAGRYSLSAYKGGYVSVWYGSKHPGQSTGAISIAITEGRQVPPITLKMLHGAVITGVVYDDSGQRAADRTVSVYRSGFDFSSGLKSFQSMFLGQTDDRGVYRLAFLAPGEYIVGAATSEGNLDVRQPSDAEWQWANRLLREPAQTNAASLPPPEPGRTFKYAPVYYPGTPVQTDATIVSLGPGEERSGIDIHIALVPTAKIEGVLTGPDAVTTANVQVRAFRSGDRGGGMYMMVTTGPQGQFAMQGLPPGSFFLSARVAPVASAPGAPVAGAASWALLPLTVDGRDQRVSLDLRPGLPVTGRVAFDGTTLQPPSDLTRIRLNLLPVSLGGATLEMASGIRSMLSSTAAVDASSHFSFTDVGPGTYRFLATVPGQTPSGNWMVRSVVIDGRDTLDTLIDIKPGSPVEAVVTFTDRTTELSGTLQDATGRPAADYFIVVFAADATYWIPQSPRVSAVRPDIDGKYRTPSLPPGEYLISAVTDVEQNQWFDPAFLAQLRGQALHVTLVEGDKKVQDLRIGG